jgi:hypothetical protein
MNKTLKSFVDYCEAHPQERFWQALRNWSGYNFIYKSYYCQHLSNDLLKDTFYIEDEK